MFCQWKLHAAEATPYTDVVDMSASDAYIERDTEVSTPGTTTNSDPEVTLSHLAEQEHGFSEGSVNIPSPDSMQSPTEESKQLPGASLGEPSTSNADVYVLNKGQAKDREYTSDFSDTEEDRPFPTNLSSVHSGGEEEETEINIVYTEKETDTSCVLHIEESDKSSSGSYDNLKEQIL